MKRIGLLSDTHAYLNPKIFSFFEDCDEIWHAGDIGNTATYEALSKFKPLRAVYGNIDGQEVRLLCPVRQIFDCEGMKVFMTHIGGYPGRYNPSALKIIRKEKPGLFISGHSHILKVMPDPKYELFHINPGAAGNSGLHKVITFLRFEVSNGKLSELEIMEIQRKSSLI
jgi:uncharacterized protein